MRRAGCARRLGGVAAVSELVDAVAATLPMGRDAAADAQARRALASLVGVALGNAGRRRWDARIPTWARRATMAMLATESALLDAADSAAQRAEELVAPTKSCAVGATSSSARCALGIGSVE